MRRLSLLFVISVVLVAYAAVASPSAARQDIELPDYLPSVEACENAWSDAATPEEAASVFVAAMLTYEIDKDLAADCFERIVDESYLTDAELSYDFNFLMDVGIGKSKDIARSYVSGATPENGYDIGKAPFVLKFIRDNRFQISNDEFRTKIVTSGQPTPRPITMRLASNGHYRITEASSLFVGVAAPR